MGKNDRLPPHDIQVEEAILSAFLSESPGTDEVIELVGPDDFYSGQNRLIYKVCLDLIKRGLICNVVSAQAELRTLGKLTEAGGSAHLIELVDSNAALSPRILREYATRIKDKSKLRQVLKVCQETSARIYCDPIIDTKEFLDGVEQNLFSVTKSGTGISSTEDASVFIDEAFEQTINALKKGEFTGLSTGLAAYDNMTGGLHNGDMTVLAARPGDGKSAYVVQVGKHIALDGYGFLLLSMEMPKSQIGTRMICAHGSVNLLHMRSGTQDPDEMARFVQAKDWLKQNLKDRFWVDDSPSLTVLDVRAKIRRKIADAQKLTPKGRLGAVACDYLQLMRSTSALTEEQQISEISRDMKSIALEFGIPVILLSQLNRQIEYRPGGEPQLSDLRSSGQIEANADNVVFIRRDRDSGTADLFLKKARSGPCGKITLKFEEEFTRFSDL